jgi:type I restriction enzyme S subunit
MKSAARKGKTIALVMERSESALRRESLNSLSLESPKRRWASVRIGDALNLINGRAFKSTEWKKTGTPIVRIQNLNNSDAPFNYFQGDLPPKFMLDDGDLLFAWSGTPGTSFGAHIWRGGKAWLNQHIFKVLFDVARFDKRFLQLAINQNLAEYIRAAHGGAGLAHITKGTFEESELPEPNLPEQRRIVAEIEKQFTRLEAGVAALRRVQTNLRRYRAAVLKAACEGRLVPTEAELAKTGSRKSKMESGAELLARILMQRRRNWRGRGKYKEPIADLYKANLPELPNGWTWASVDQLSLKVVDGVHKKPNYVPSGIPFVTVRNLTAGPGISLDKLNYITLEDHEEFIKRANPEAGDILVSKDGTLGVIRVIKTAVKFSIFVSVAMVKPAVREMSSYLGIALSAPQVQAQMIPKGSGLQHIHLEDLREDCIPLPPLPEQTRIVSEVERRLSVVEELEVVVSANLKRASRLRQSILQKAFTNKLMTSNGGAIT